MATFVNFKCSKCDKEFSLRSGLLQNDLAVVAKGEDLPGGVKLPGKKVFAKLAGEKTAEASFDFINALLDHRKKCDGEVKLTGIVFAH